MKRATPRATLLLALALLPSCLPAARPITTDGLVALVRETPVAPGRAACAVLDADGTLWGENLSGAVVERAIAERAVSDGGLPALNALLASFGLPRAASVYEASRAIDAAYDSGALLAAGRRRGWDEDEVAVRSWPHYNLLFVGMPPAAVAALTDRFLDGPDRRDGIFPGMRAVVAALRARGLRLHVISGGVHEIVAAGASRLGFAPEEVHGLRLAYREGRISDEVVSPIPYHRGKAQLALALCGGPPMFAFGDSVDSGDSAMLEAAARPVAVRPHGRHRDAARRRGMLILERPEVPASAP